MYRDPAVAPGTPVERPTALESRRPVVSRSEFERRFYPRPPRYGKALFGFMPDSHRLTTPDTK